MRFLRPVARLFLLLTFSALGCAVSRPVARVDSLPLVSVTAITESPAPAPADPPLFEGRPRGARRGQVGTASFYDASFNGRPTANGETYRDDRLTAAHRTFRFGTRVRVTNLENRKSVVVTVNDRGPYVGGRVIDLSRRAARTLGFVEDGTTRVRVQPL